LDHAFYLIETGAALSRRDRDTPGMLLALTRHVMITRHGRPGGRGLALVQLLVLTLTGWLHIILNGEPRFMLIDDRGVATRLQLDPVQTRPFGGPRAINGKRVTITGEPSADQPQTIRVLTIELIEENR
jgi:hypothetical protein